MGRRASRTCQVCTANYVPTYGAQRTCGRECGAVLKARENPPKGRTPHPAEPRQMDCPTCGAAFTAAGNQTYCTHRCRPSWGKSLLATGAAGSLQPLYRAGTYEDRLLSRYLVERSGCWRWLGTMMRTAGYGQIGRHGRNIPAHVAMYEHSHGTVPTGLHLDHLCHNRWCVNPDHLEPVTTAENNRRARSSAA